MKNHQLWVENLVQQKSPSKANIKLFKDELEKAEDEKPLQEVLETTPSLLRSLTLNTSDFWCFGEPSLGGELYPDFLLCCEHSGGFEWTFVELESPTKPALIKSGLPAEKLRFAQGQINDWRIWLRQNIAYAQSHLGFRGIHAEGQAWIVIGRRSMISPKHALKYQELSTNNLRVISYDRFIDMIQQG